MNTEPAALRYIDLSYVDVLLAAGLILINGALSAWLRLKLARQLFLAATRTVVQLSLIGVALQWVFHNAEWPVIVTWMFLMTLIAGIASVQRTSKRFPGIWLNSVVAVMASSWLVTAYALLVLVRPEHWYQPQYAIPLLGMILGNTLNGISLGLDRLTEELGTKRDEVEMLLTLGATRWEAARDAVQNAIRTGMIPIINTMMVVGLVSLPGMMTGQLLAGASPAGAVRYQIAIMFLIASGTALGTVGVVLLSFLRLFNCRHQFLESRIRKLGQT